jgi:hypothetical protein
MTYNWWCATSTQGPVDDWTLITKEIFDDFWLVPDYQTSPYQPSQTTSSTSTINATPTFVRPNDPIDEFKKGIKRDSSLFAVYKDEKQWDNWQQSTIAIACAQGVEECF